MGVFISLYGVSALLAIDKPLAFLGGYGWNYQGMIFATALVVVFYLAQKNKFLPSAIIKILQAVIFGIFVSFLISIMEFGYRFNDFLNTRISGPQFHPVSYGIYLGIGLMALIGLLSLTKNKINRWLSAMGTMLVLFLILSNGTRSVWIAVVISVVVYCGFFLYLHPRYIQIILIQKVKIIIASLFLLGGLGLVLFGWNHSRERIFGAFGSPDIDPSVAIRLNEWNTSLKIIKDQGLFGKGPGSIYFLYPLYRSPKLNNLKGGDLDLVAVRNVYLDYAANLGILPASLILLFFLTILVESIRLLFNSHVLMKKKEIFLSVFGVWFYLLIVNLFYYYTITSAVFFWFFSGIITTFLKEKYFFPEKNISFKFSIFFRIIFSFFVLIFFLVVQFWIIRIFYSEWIFAKSSSLTNLDFAVKEIEKSVSITPFDIRKLRMLSLKEQALASTLLNQPRMYDFYINKSLKDIEKAIEISPYDFELYNTAGLIYFKSYLLTKNLDLLKKVKWYASQAYTLNPSKALYADNLGEYYLAEGNLAKAEVYFQEAIFLKKNYFIGYYHLGEVAKQKGKFEDAVNWYLKSLQCGGSAAFVQGKIGEINDLQDKLLQK